MNRKSDHPLRQGVVEQIEDAAVTRYSNRLRQFGADPRTLGWDTSQSQNIRFQAVTELVSCAQKVVVDIGCGFADFYYYLCQQGQAPTDYLGIDISEDLLTVAQKRFPDLRFENRNLLNDPVEAPVADIGVMLGLLNFRLSEVGNYAYAEAMIRAAFASVRESLVIDCLSSYRTAEYPEESFVFYYEPERLLSFALTLTPKVTLKQDYPAIPQREFMLCLRK